VYAKGTKPLEDDLTTIKSGTSSNTATILRREAKAAGLRPRAMSVRGRSTAWHQRNQGKRKAGGKGSWNGEIDAICVCVY
jgi:hypothetical protein